MGVFSEMGLFSELTLRGHNLSKEGPISKLKDAFSSCLVVLKNGVLKSVIFFLVQIVHFLEKSVGYKWVFFLKWAYFRS